MKVLSGFAAAALMATIVMTSCSEKKQYNLTGQVDEQYNESPVLLISMASGDTLATTTVLDGNFTFTGEAPSPELAQIRVGGRAVGNVVLEPGDILFSSEVISGTPLNEVLSELRKKEQHVTECMLANQNDSTKQAEIEQCYNAYQAYSDSVMMANIDNPVGASLLIENAYEMQANTLDSVMNAHPSLKAYARINKILEQKNIAAETGVGKPYKDFEVVYDGQTQKLSELMQPDHYTLVDFWASWCGPCRREIPVIKEILNEWGPKGLDVVGVAVWDEPEATKKAMEQLDITWPVIIDAQKIPTDMYGILGIPCIMVIGPDGTILLRDLQGQELKDAVAAIMTK